jgi:hypothetical protein
VVGSASFVYLIVSLVAVALITVTTAAWFAARFIARTCWRWIRTQMSVRRAMKGFDRNLQRILAPHPSERGNGHFPKQGDDNNRDST